MDSQHRDELQAPCPWPLGDRDHCGVCRWARIQVGRWVTGFRICGIQDLRFTFSILLNAGLELLQTEKEAGRVVSARPHEPHVEEVMSLSTCPLTDNLLFKTVLTALQSYRHEFITNYLSMYVIN